MLRQHTMELKPLPGIGQYAGVDRRILVDVVPVVRIRD